MTTKEAESIEKRHKFLHDSLFFNDGSPLCEADILSR